MYEVQFPGLGLEFEVNPVAFQFGPIQIGPFEFGTVYWYGIIMAVGLILAFLYASLSCKKMRINEDKLINCVIAGVIFGMIGARLYYVIFYPGDTCLLYTSQRWMPLSRRSLHWREASVRC